MIKVILEFQNVDAAIVALGKLVGAGERQGRVTPPAPAVQETAVPAPAIRKGRSDKGHKRGANAATTQAAPPAAPAEGDKPQPSGVMPADGAVTALTAADAEKALEAVFNGKGLAVAQDLLSRFGVKRLRDLKPEQYQEFVTDAGKVAA